MAAFTVIGSNNNSSQKTYFVTTLQAKYIMVATLLSLLLNLTSCNPDSVNPANSDENAYSANSRATAIIDSNSTLKEVAFFPIGAAINPKLLSSNKLYKSTLQKEYNSISTENSVKMNVIQPKPGQFNWTDTDALVNFAKSSNMRVHGHTLVWYKSLPEWVSTFKGDSTAWENLLKTHIQTVVGRYKGKITSWDVVNEAFEDDGTLRKSVWYNNLGPGYIARSFQYAHEADPTALLFYNDNVVDKPKKLAAVLALLKDLKKQNVGINGVGVQMHINVSTSEEGLTADIRQFANTGLLVHLSELDIRMNPTYSTKFTLTASVKNAQSLKYKAVAVMFKRIVPKSQQFGITNWNVGDSDSWLRKTSTCEDYPLLFDDNYNKKLSYYGFMQGLME